MSEREIRVVHAGSEHVNAPQLVAIALGCLCVGIAFTHLVTRYAPGSRLPEPSFGETSIFSAMDAPPEEPAPPAIVPKADGKVEARALAAALVAPSATAEPRGSTTAHPVGASRGWHASHRFQAAGVVYVACGGAAAHGRVPSCPHDRALESAVWRSLKLLASCYTATPENGHAELHITVLRSRALEVEIAAPARGRSLNLRAVGQCAVPRLSKLRSHFKLNRAQITFRFGLS